MGSILKEIESKRTRDILTDDGKLFLRRGERERTLVRFDRGGVGKYYYACRCSLVGMSERKDIIDAPGGEKTLIRAPR